MAQPLNLSNRLLLASRRSSASRPIDCLHRHPRIWIRAITSISSPRTAVPRISFGEENDVILQEYIAKQEGAAARKQRTKDEADLQGSKTRKARIETLQEQQEAEGRVAQQKSPSKIKGKREEIVNHTATANDGFEIGEFIDRSKPVAEPRSEAAAAASTQVKSKGQPPKGKSKSKKGLKEKLTLAPSALSAQEQPPYKPTPKEPWMEQKNALKKKFEEGWSPRKKLSPDAMEGIRTLHEQDPLLYSTANLSQQFRISPEAVRRILKSNWLSKQPAEKVEERKERWAKRHDRIWDQQSELGLRPKRKKDKGVEDPDKFEQDLAREKILEQERMAG